MPSKTNPIASLFREIGLGNTRAFDELFITYYDKVLAFALQYTKQPESAEEITSELFVRIWLKRAMLAEVQNPEVYLFVSIKNACLNWIRANQKRAVLFVSGDVQTAERPLDFTGNLLAEKELARLLDRTVAALPEQRRIIFKLIKEQGLKRHEVAEILGLSIRTVENQLHKAIIHLADAISGYLGYDPRKKTDKKMGTGLNILFF